MSYVFKPPASLTDRVAEVVEQVQKRVPEARISRFYEFSALRGLNEYQQAPGLFERDFQDYLTRRKEGQETHR